MEKLSLKASTFQFVVWVFFYLMFYHPFYKETGAESSPSVFAVYSLVFGIQMVAVWFNVSILAKYLFDKQRYVYYLFGMSVLIITTSAVIFHVSVWGIRMLAIKAPVSDHSLFGYFLVINLLLVGISQIFNYQKNWHSLREKSMEHEKEKVSAELAALKAQINPHLLFNSLNNIYSLSLDKSDLAPEMILKLSDLMSYVLYECKTENVRVGAEKRFLTNYIELEQMRFADNFAVTYDFSACADNYLIAPLLFLPFVENAFKHVGAGNNQCAYISIALSCEGDNRLRFTVSNSIQEHEQKPDEVYSGIGIDTIKKRLAYLYPDNHQLQIDKTDTDFAVALSVIVGDRV